MSTSLMIFIGENIKFDFSSTIKAISSMDNAENIRIMEQNLTGKNSEDSIGSVLDCEYKYEEEVAFVRFDNSLDFISVKRPGKASLDFAFKLQSLIEQPLTATDTDYSFQVKLKNIASVEEFEQLMCSGVYME